MLAGRELNVDVVGAVDDVAVRDDVAVAVDHEANRLRCSTLPAAESIPEI
jgi:hypothetical protein